MVSLLKKSLTNDQSTALGTLTKAVTILPDIRYQDILLITINTKNYI